MSKIETLHMSKEDLLYLKETLQEEYDVIWNYNILEQEFYSENTTYIVAKEGNKILGFAGMLTIIDESNIMNIAVKKTERKKGVGSLLLQKLIDLSKEKKLKLITLEVAENNIPAINLYQKFNFEKVGLRKKYYNNSVSAILMTLYI